MRFRRIKTILMLSLFVISLCLMGCDNAVKNEIKEEKKHSYTELFGTWILDNYQDTLGFDSEVFCYIAASGLSASYVYYVGDSIRLYVSDKDNYAEYKWSMADDGRHMLLTFNDGVTYKATKISDTRCSFDYHGTWELINPDDGSALVRFSIGADDKGVAYYYDSQYYFGMRANCSKSKYLSIYRYPLLEGFSDEECYMLTRQMEAEGILEGDPYFHDGQFCIYTDYQGKVIMKLFHSNSILRYAVKVSN